MYLHVSKWIHPAFVWSLFLVHQFYCFIIILLGIWEWIQELNVPLNVESRPYTKYSTLLCIFQSKYILYENHSRASWFVRSGGQVSLTTRSIGPSHGCFHLSGTALHPTSPFLGGMTLFSNRAALDPFVIRPSYWGGWRHPTMYRAPGPPKIAFCSGEHSFQHRLHTKSAWRKSSMRLQAAARTVLLAFCSQTPPTTFIWCSLHQCPHRSPWMQMQ